MKPISKREAREAADAGRTQAQTTAQLITALGEKLPDNMQETVSLLVRNAKGMETKYRALLDWIDGGAK